MWRYVYRSQKTGLVLLLSDIFGLVVAFNVAHKVATGTWVGLGLPIFAVLAPVTVLLLYLADGYRVELRNWGIRLVARSLISVVIAAAIVAAASYITKAADANPIFWRTSLIGGYVIFAVYSALARILVSAWAQWKQKNMRWLVVGTGECAAYLRKEFETSSIKGDLFFVDVSDGTSTDAGTGDVVDAEVVPAMKGIDSLDAAFRMKCTGIVIAEDEGLNEAAVSRLMDIRLKGMRIYDLVDFYESYFYKVPVLHLRDGWFALSHGFDLLHPNIHLKLKRVIDFSLSALLTIVLSPLMIMIALLVLLEGQGSIFFSQTRTGLNGREFKLYKYRTMIPDAERGGPRWAEENDPRVTPLGRILRATRLDELPQLWNVFVGDMSFIGPRPERPEFNKILEQQIPYYELRYLVKPGITGWAQVMYPYGSSVEDARHKLQYDLYYIKNYSVLLDVVIAIKTLRIVIFGKGR